MSSHLSVVKIEPIRSKIKVLNITKGLSFVVNQENERKGLSFRLMSTFFVINGTISKNQLSKDTFVVAYMHVLVNRSCIIDISILLITRLLGWKSNSSRTYVISVENGYRSILFAYIPPWLLHRSLVLQVPHSQYDWHSLVIHANIYMEW